MKIALSLILVGVVFAILFIAFMATLGAINNLMLSNSFIAVIITASVLLYFNRERK